MGKRFFNPAENFVGGFTCNDGEIDFYLRVNSLLKPQFNVLDLGAGRAAWFEDDDCETRRSIRLLKGKVNKVIAADVDNIVINNRASDEQLLVEGEELNLQKDSMDIVIADYVLEHIENPEIFFKQVNACLKSGGWFCARTPHKLNYVSLFAKLIKNSSHAKILKYAQPTRKAIDVFPTHYKMNSLSEINKIFNNWSDKSFIYRQEPAYYFGSKIIFKILSFLHGLFPSVFVGSLYIFVKKP